MVELLSIEIEAEIGYCFVVCLLEDSWLGYYHFADYYPDYFDFSD